MLLAENHSRTMNVGNENAYLDFYDVGRFTT